MKLNRKAFEFAKELVKDGKVKETSSWEPPTPEEENRYIEENGFEKYSLWFLGIREDAEEETKQRYAFPFTDDFKKVNRRGVIAIKQRASQYGYDDIFEAASKLLEMIDAEGEKRFFKTIAKYQEKKGNTFVYTITTEREDRVGDIVRVNGCRFENFLKNPVVLFNHDENKPVGKVVGINIVDGRIEAEIEFSKTQFGQEIQTLVEEGILNAVSIGFIPLKKEPREKGGYDIQEWELLEVSIVPIPANPEALIRKYLETKIENFSQREIEKQHLGVDVVIKQTFEEAKKIIKGG